MTDERTNSEIIAACRAKGMSYREVATYLNDMGRTTRTGTEWTPGTVSSNYKYGLARATEYKAVSKAEEQQEALVGAMECYELTDWQRARMTRARGKAEDIRRRDRLAAALEGLRAEADALGAGL